MNTRLIGRASPAIIALVAAALLCVACHKHSAPSVAAPSFTAEGLLAIGSKAPDFAAADETGTTVTLRSFRGRKNVVLVFYPGDDTPGCTKQLCAIRDDIVDFEKTDIAAFGVNPQSAVSHRKFIARYGFPFPLLVDEGMRVAKAYGCAGHRTARRTVYGIDKKGRIVFAERGLPSDQAILAAFQR